MAYSIDNKYVVIDGVKAFNLDTMRFINERVNASDYFNSNLKEKKYRELKQQLQLSLTDNCNMKCEYCSFRPRNGLNKKVTEMDFNTVEKSIDIFKNYLTKIDSKYARIDYGVSGETFMMKNYHNKITNYIEKKFKDSGVNGIWVGPNITNGTYIEIEDIEEFIGEPQDVSCDGPKYIHDTMRKYKDGKGTYDDLESFVKKAKELGKNIGVSCVLTSKNMDFIEIFTHLHDKLGFNSIYMKPVNLKHDNEIGLNAKTVNLFKESYTELINFIMNQEHNIMIEYLLALNEEDFFMRYVYRVINQVKLVYRCGAGKSGIYVDTDGKLYPCAHFIGDSQWSIGDVDYGYKKDTDDQFLKLHVDYRVKCKECWAKYFCGGGCYYQAILANDSIQNPDESKCELIKHLVYEAIRLVHFLSENAQEVLDMLPRSPLVDCRIIEKELLSNYRPISRLINYDDKNYEVKQQCGIIEDKFIVRKENNKLIIKFNKKIMIEGNVYIWIVNLRDEFINIVDIQTLGKDRVGSLYKIDSKGRLNELSKSVDKIIKVPYQNKVWKNSEHAKIYTNDSEYSVTIEFLDEVSEIGINLYIEDEHNRINALCKMEPFCMIGNVDDGELKYFDCVNSENIKYMNSFMSHVNIKPNTC